jgi:hypothetical protein
MPGAPDPDVVAALNDALDGVLDQFQRSGIGTLPTDSEIARFYFSTVTARRREWQRPKSCLYPQCHGSSVSSHAVPRKGPLSAIAENGQVITPALSHEEGHIGVQLVGLRRASTFPGFCPEHEARFGHFEQKRDYRDERFLHLQAFRTICRELAIKNNALTSVERALQEYEDLIGKRINDLVRTSLGEAFFPKYPDFKIGHCTTNAFDWRRELLRHTSERIARYRDDLVQDLYAPAVESLQSNSDALAGVMTELPIEVPVVHLR